MRQEWYVIKQNAKGYLANHLIRLMLNWCVFTDLLENTLHTKNCAYVLSFVMSFWKRPSSRSQFSYIHQAHFTDTGAITCHVCPMPAKQFWGICRQATGLDAWASRVKCPARFVSHLHEICIYIWVFYSLCFFCCLFITVTWWYVWCIEWASGNQEEVQACLVGNLMAIYHIMLQFIQNHSRFVMLMIWK